MLSITLHQLLLVDVDEAAPVIDYPTQPGTCPIPSPFLLLEPYPLSVSGIFLPLPRLFLSGPAWRLRTSFTYCTAIAMLQLFKHATHHLSPLPSCTLVPSVVCRPRQLLVTDVWVFERHLLQPEQPWRLCGQVLLNPPTPAPTPTLAPSPASASSPEAKSKSNRAV